MHLDSTDYTMVRSSHLHPLVTAEVEHTVPLCGKFADTTFRNIIIYRIVTVLKVGKYFVPKFLQVIDRFFQIAADIFRFCFQLFQLYRQVLPERYLYFFCFQALPSSVSFIGDELFFIVLMCRNERGFLRTSFWLTGEEI